MSEYTAVIEIYIQISADSLTLSRHGARPELIIPRPLDEPLMKQVCAVFFHRVLAQQLKLAGDKWKGLQ